MQKSTKASLSRRTILAAFLAFATSPSYASEQDSVHVTQALVDIRESAPSEQRPFVDCYIDFSQRLGSRADSQTSALMTSFLRAYSQFGLQKRAGWEYLHRETHHRHSCTVYWQAFTGVMAHLAHDMPYTLIDAFPNRASLEAARPSYDAIGDDLVASIPAIQDLLSHRYDPFISVVSGLAPFQLDIEISAAQIRKARQTSFEIALRYVDGQITEAELETESMNSFNEAMVSVNAVETILASLPGYKNQCNEQ